MTTSVTPICITDVEQWSEEMSRLSQRFTPRFKRVETKRHTQGYLQDLLSGGDTLDN